MSTDPRIAQMTFRLADPQIKRLELKKGPQGDRYFLPSEINNVDEEKLLELGIDGILDLLTTDAFTERLHKYCLQTNASDHASTDVLSSFMKAEGNSDYQGCYTILMKFLDKKLFRRVSKTPNEKSSLNKIAYHNYLSMMHKYTQKIAKTHNITSTVNRNFNKHLTTNFDLSNELQAKENLGRKMVLDAIRQCFLTYEIKDLGGTTRGTKKFYRKCFDVRASETRLSARNNLNHTNSINSEMEKKILNQLPNLKQCSGDVKPSYFVDRRSGEMLSGKELDRRFLEESANPFDFYERPDPMMHYLQELAHSVTENIPEDEGDRMDPELSNSINTLKDVLSTQPDNYKSIIQQLTTINRLLGTNLQIMLNKNQNIHHPNAIPTVPVRHERAFIADRKPDRSRVRGL